MNPVAEGNDYKTAISYQEKKVLLLLHVFRCCGVVDISPHCQTSGAIFWGKGGLRLLCVSISDCLFHVSMGLPTVLSQLWDCRQCMLQRRAASYST